MRQQLRELRSIFLTPISGGRVRSGQYPHARTSLLSIISFFLFFIVMIGGVLAKASGHPIPDKFLGIMVFLPLALVFLSSGYDERRDRRLGLLPRRHRWFLRR